MTLELQLPRKLGFLMEPHTVKVTPHGRGAGTSWSYARALLVQGIQKKLRIPCARETMQSIADSVHAVLKEQIEMLGMDRHYTVYESYIAGTNGTKFTFHGLRSNVTQIKSLEGSDRFWVEEAENVSKSSWDVLQPTVFRHEGSELWVNFNPKLQTDETNKRFVMNPPPGAKVVHLTWRDNPWFPPLLRLQMEHMKATDPIGYRNIWEGEYISAIVGAIFADQIKAATTEGRIGNVPVDRTKPVDTFWDLGFGDLTTIWFAQAVDGWYHIVDYLEGAGKTIADYCIELQNRGYLYGVDWLPHDAVDTIIHKKLGGGDKSRSIEQLMRAAGRNVRIAAKMFVSDSINATRTIFPQCRFDEEKCADGLMALRHYQWKPLAHADDHRDPRTAFAHQTPVQPEPLHNWASHGADGFRTLAVCIKQPRKEDPPSGLVERLTGGVGGRRLSWMG